MSKYVRTIIGKVKAYAPGEQPAPGSKVIKLNTNENPYPPSPQVKLALRQIDSESLRQYPEPGADTFRRAAARVLGVDSEMIIAGNGSDELLNLLVRAYVEPGQAVAYPVPTYSLYLTLAEIQGATVIEIPFNENFELPDDLPTCGASLIFLSNPNAPTGTFIEPQAIEQLARRFDGVVVVDEAYVDFADDNCLRLVDRNRNIVVLRTFSKSYSMAGVRFGYAVAPRPIVKDLMKIKDSYNCDVVSIRLATAAIEDQAYMRRISDKIRRQRTYLTGQLEKLGFVVRPSSANFIWAQAPMRSAKTLYLTLKDRGILVRYFDKVGLRRNIRITVGLPKENKALIDALADILSELEGRR